MEEKIFNLRNQRLIQETDKKSLIKHQDRESLVKNIKSFVGGTADTLPVISPLAACKHTKAYPQVSGHLGGNQDPADEKEDSSVNL